MKRHYHFAFDEKYDAEVIEKLDSEESTTRYVRQLVLNDLIKEPTHEPQEVFDGEA